MFEQKPKYFVCNSRESFCKIRLWHSRSDRQDTSFLDRCSIFGVQFNFEHQTHNFKLAYPHLQLLAKIVDSRFKIWICFHHVFYRFQGMNYCAMITSTKVLTNKCKG